MYRCIITVRRSGQYQHAKHSIQTRNTLMLRIFTIPPTAADNNLETYMNTNSVTYCSVDCLYLRVIS